MYGFYDDIGIVGHEVVIFYWHECSEMHYSHIHPQYEIYFCVDNVEQKAVINGTEFNFKHPCVIISTPYTIHSASCENKNAESYERFVFHYTEKAVDTFIPHFLPKDINIKNSALFFKLTDEQANILKKIILSSLPKSNEGRELLLALFLNKLIEVSPIKDAVKVGTSFFYIQDVLQYISQNFSEPIDTNSISHIFSVSRSKLDRDFKRFTGDTVHGFIDNCRLNNAKYLLEYKTELSIATVAKICGFSGETYFYPFFKKQVGITPIEYRKKKQQETKNTK